MIFNPEISRDEINQLPLGGFEGKIHVISKPSDIGRVIASLKKNKFVGFDTETRPAFVKGQKFPISLTQLASESEAFLIRNKYTGWPKPLLKFLADSSVLKIGIGIRDDLQSMRSEVPQTWEPGGFVELNSLVKELGIVSQGVRKLSGLILGFRVSKSAQTSNWEKSKLDEKQLKYAATDAWCCHQIYNSLLKRGYVE